MSLGVSRREETSIRDDVQRQDGVGIKKKGVTEGETEGESQSSEARRTDPVRLESPRLRDLTGTSGVPSSDWFTAARGHAHLAETTESRQDMTSLFSKKVNQ
ncbi:hypothetical protein EYF80_068200 [Liparis tanakae]|uniref:Uncharacterized protein n=1 Tax=Liparis tanakae TaxID=230148 RepID=A0A4Z2DZ11_9TELE|nr:hypothetical protein EYF80_068200 [Liparis tanakae]